MDAASTSSPTSTRINFLPEERFTDNERRMAFVPGFAHDVFISYASADNSSRPGHDGEWVSRFHGSISQRLRMLVGTSDLNVYRDPKLAGLDTDSGLEQVREAAIIVAIVSERYVQSDFCLRELDAFSEAHGDAPRRLFPVWVAAIDRDILPVALANATGSRFFSQIPGAGSRRFSQEEGRNPQYWQALDDLSRHVVATLKELRRDAPRPHSTRGVVYLAEVAGEVDGYRDRLRRALVQRGVTVLPEQSLPRTRSALHVASEADLRRSIVSVHLLGNDYGPSLLDDEVSAAQAQAEVAAAVARDGRLRRVVWMSPEASRLGITDERQREFRRWVEIVESSDEFLEGGFEELKSVVFDAVATSSPPAAFPIAPMKSPLRPVTPASAPTPLPALPPAAVVEPAVAEPAHEVFISYSRADAGQFAVQLSEALGERGVRVWIDVKGIRAGANFRRAIEEALYRCTHMLIVLSPKAADSDEVMGEVNVALDDKKPVLPLLYLPCRIPSYLRLRQHVNFANLAASDAGAIASVRPGARHCWGYLVRPPMPDLESPFPGLRPFEEQDAALFFGRDDQLQEMLARLERERTLTVIGLSGSGKSSMVCAGLVPALRSRMHDGARWRIGVMRPGSVPIDALATALTDVIEGSDDREAASETLAFRSATLRRGALGLVEAVAEAALDPGDRVLIVVDQLEELFRFIVTRRDGVDESRAFVQLLGEAVLQREHPIFVVLTLRAEFVGDCATVAGLAQLINLSPCIIPSLTRQGLRHVIEDPLRESGAAISNRLVNRLLNDVGDDQLRLPILQHAMMRTWEEWVKSGRKGPIDLEAYERVGGLGHALALHAEAAYASLDDEGQRAAACVFGALADTIEARLVRRPERLGSLIELSRGRREGMIRTIDFFRAWPYAFLMPPAGLPLTDETVIDITHESLIRLWPRMAEWTREEQRRAELYRRLESDANRWSCGQASLWRGPELAQARQLFESGVVSAAWANRYGEQFDLAMRDLAESVQESTGCTAREYRALRGARIKFALLAAVIGAAVGVLITFLALR